MGLAEDIEAEKLSRYRVDFARISGAEELVAALFDRGLTLQRIGMFFSSVEAFEECIRVSETDPLAARMRLTAEMNLCDVLMTLGDNARAVELATKSLAARESFYGVGHAGYAYGARELAVALLRARRATDAVAPATDAFTIFAAEKHQETPFSLAVLGCARVAARTDSSAFGEARDLSDAQLDEMLMGTRGLATTLGDEMREAVLRVAIAAARSRDRIGTEAGSTLLFVLGCSLHDRGRYTEAVAFWRDATTELDSKKRPDIAVHAAIGVANALEKAGDREAADAAYAEAARRGRELGPNEHSRMLTNYGLALDERGDPRALEVLAEAALIAESGADVSSRIYAVSSLGIRLQHRGHFARAAEALRRARDLAPPMSVDGFCAQQHLTFAERGEECKCGKETLPTFVEALSRTLAQVLPAGLVEDVTAEEGKDVIIRCTRDLTTDEDAILRLVREQSRSSRV